MPPRRVNSPAKKRQQMTPSTPKGKVATKEFLYEFGGIPGAAGVIVGLPFAIFLLYFGCQKQFCVDSFGSVAALPSEIASGLVGGGSKPLWSWDAAAVVFGWTAVHFAFYVLLPGPRVQGVVLPGTDGKRLKYPMNGHLAFWLSLAACNGLPLGPKGAWVRPDIAWLYDHYLELISASMALSLLISVFCYAVSFRKGEVLAAGGVSGNALYDFFIGRALNPRIGDLDLKCACELRPGLIGWTVINMGMAAKQLQLDGAISGPMLCVNAFQMLYVWDALYQEQAILTTMDITTDGFGFMLAFGDLSWVPFTYSLQARILVEHDPELSTAALCAITALNVLGYAIFRGANSEKDAFRRDPSAPEVAHLAFIETKRGSRLLTSGWWGMARKINYTGDWLMGLSWCLCCGAISPVAYFYAIYFFVLLVHRSMRDDHSCSVKYGDDWKRYKAAVPALFIPHVW